MADVLVVVKANMGKVQGCGSRHGATGIIKVKWKILPGGGVTDAQITDSTFVGTPVGNCVTNEVKSWKFPASRGSTPVKFPMKLSG